MPSWRGGRASPRATPDIGVQSYPWQPSANIAHAKRGGGIYAINGQSRAQKRFRPTVVSDSSDFATYRMQADPSAFHAQLSTVA